MRLRFERLQSPIGPLLLVSDGAALRALTFDEDDPALDGAVAGAVPKAILDAICAYFAGDLTAIDRIPVETAGSEFQRSVWAALRAIPVGTTTTYGELAARIGRPGASRAVGLANGSNPVAIVVPCHRVIGADGTLTGYGGGLSRKRWLLEHERAISAQLAL
jgi:methylated-DNA-[protein]-cysteine S-methyltransferase